MIANIGIFIVALSLRERNEERVLFFPSYALLFTFTLFVWTLTTFIRIEPIELIIASFRQIWSFMAIVGLYFILSRGSSEALLYILRYLSLLPVINLPFVLVQRALSQSSTNWDMVSGTLGKNGSAELLVVTISSMIFAHYLHTRKSINTLRYRLVIISSIIIFTLAEVKAFLVLIPVAFAIYLYHDFAAKPLRFLFNMALACLVAFAILSFYLEFNTKTRYRDLSDMSISEFVQNTVLHFLDQGNFDKEAGELGRVASVSFWYRNVSDDFQGMLIGYGLGSSRQSSLSDGRIAKEFGNIKLGRTSLSQLLWETGIVGTLLFVLTLFVFICSMLLSSVKFRSLVPSREYSMLAALMSVFLLSLLYKNILLESQYIRSIFCFIFAYAWLLNKQRRASQIAAI